MIDSTTVPVPSRFLVFPLFCGHLRDIGFSSVPVWVVAGRQCPVCDGQNADYADPFVLFIPIWTST